MRLNMGYFWAERKREIFFSFVALFAIGQMMYREFVVKQQQQQRMLGQRRLSRDEMGIAPGMPTIDVASLPNNRRERRSS
jgi:hypothetical protein